MNPTDVVAAIIKKGDHYLLAKRSKEKYMGLKWEFPGGKVEQNETFKDALSREILEELNVNIEIHDKVAEERYQEKNYISDVISPSPGTNSYFKKSCFLTHSIASCSDKTILVSISVQR